MSYFRSYFEKNNTILKNTHVNTSKNPTTEIFYGSSHSRFLFKIDLTDLIKKINDGHLVINSNTTHTLHLTNTIFGNGSLIGQFKGTGRERAASFQLELYKLTENWNEGIGYDYEDSVYDFTKGNQTFNETPSNWYNRTTLESWTNTGSYGGSGTTIVNLIHFDNGNENINLDITDYINGIILSGNTNYGLGLKFINDFENLSVNTDKSVSFFTKYTQTFFEPYLETKFDDRILDSRYNFIEKLHQKLYLYVFKGTNSYDLDELPVVDILDPQNQPINGLTGLTTTKIKKGVYEVILGINGIVCDGRQFFKDKWKNIKIDGITASDITQRFIPKQYTSIYTIGENKTELHRYIIQFYGIKQNEKIKRGEIRKIIINLKSINNSNVINLNDISYRIFIKEGKVDVIIHDWTLIDITNEKSFLLDTSYLIPREYYMQIKGNTHNEETFYDEFIKFEILSEK